MRLADLEPAFVRFESRLVELGRDRVPTEREVHVEVATLAEAQGIRFLCPVCFQANRGPVGTHAVCVAFRDRGVHPAHGSQGDHGPTRWAVSGRGVADLTLTPSIDLSRRPGGCGWHGFVTNGEVTSC